MRSVGCLKHNLVLCGLLRPPVLGRVMPVWVVATFLCCGDESTHPQGRARTPTFPPNTPTHPTHHPTQHTHTQPRNRLGSLVQRTRQRRLPPQRARGSRSDACTQQGSAAPRSPDKHAAPQHSTHSHPLNLLLSLCSAELCLKVDLSKMLRYFAALLLAAVPLALAQDDCT